MAYCRQPRILAIGLAAALVCLLLEGCAEGDVGGGR